MSKASLALHPRHALGLVALTVAGVFFSRSEYFLATAAATTPRVAAMSRRPPAGAEGAAAALNRFGGALLGATTAASAGQPVFLSPLSVASALSMVAAGAAGDTAAAFDAVLGGLSGDAGAGALRALASASPSDSNATLLLANSLWTRGGGVKAAFKADVAGRFNASVHALSTAAAANEWVSSATKGYIKQLLDEAVVSNPLTKALLLNAVFFKGDWETPFKHAATVASVFASPGVAGGVPCQMMSRPPSELAYASTPAGQAVVLPYAGGAYRALLVLPPLPETAPHGGGGALRDTPGEALASLRAALRPTRLGVKLPRFKLEWGVASLKPGLIAIGLQPAFSSPGGFLKMSDDPDFHLADVLHKVVLEVNEEGSVAAAATAAVMMTRSLGPPPLILVFDRPFLMAIETADGAPLFMGMVENPTFT